MLLWRFVCFLASIKLVFSDASFFCHLFPDVSMSQQWWKKASFQIYICHIFSSWGDRMWSFAVGLYMGILFPDSLLLTAIYGFASCGAVIIFGPYIGSWIDKSKRINAAQYSVLLQNGAVGLGAAFLAPTTYFQSGLKSHWNGILEYVIIGVIVVVAILAELASVANKIALEKDWIVVLAAGDEKKLARLNSTMRTINLTTYILAPIVVGQVAHASHWAGAVFVAGWNIISGVVEYKLLRSIYNSLPGLGAKDNEPNPNSTKSINSTDTNSQNDAQSQDPKQKASEISSELSAEPLTITTTSSETETILPNETEAGDKVTKTKSSESIVNLNNDLKDSQKNNNNNENINKTTKDNAKKYSAADGWRKYFQHRVFFSGLALATLYMTVLGFDIVTTVFAYNQGINESFIGVLAAFGAVFGIAGSLLFPFLRRRIGILKTGILGFLLETLSLLFCVGSVFAHGSPFKPSAVVKRFNSLAGIELGKKHEVLSIEEIYEKRTHLIYLFVGIIVARFGLWIADLSVTQIFQEEIEEEQRGIINGVQDSLNRFMDLIKFFLTLLLPAPETFGFLVFLSWSFVFLGMLLFITFAKKTPKVAAEKTEPIPVVPLPVLS